MASSKYSAQMSLSSCFRQQKQKQQEKQMAVRACTPTVAVFSLFINSPFFSCRCLRFCCCVVFQPEVATVVADFSKLLEHAVGGNTDLFKEALCSFPLQDLLSVDTVSSLVCVSAVVMLAFTFFCSAGFIFYTTWLKLFATRKRTAK